MSNDALNQAIQLIQQGQNDQAQAILQGLIKANQQDLTAWSWYVKSCSTPEKRLEALELSLRFNPGNPQIMEAIQKLRGKLLVASKPTLEPVRAPENLISTREPEPYAYPYAVIEKPEAVSNVDVYNEPLKFIGLDEVSGRPLMWWDVWWMAIRYPDPNAYAALLQDPLANLGRAYWWTFLAALVLGLLSLINPELTAMARELEKLEGGEIISAFLGVGVIAIVPFIAVINVVMMTLGALFYTLLARMLGGTGNFTRTFYLMSAYNAPISILTGILAIIPCLNLLNIFISLYSFRLQVVAVEAAHRLNGGRAALAVFLPIGVSIVISCLLGILISVALRQALRG